MLDAATAPARILVVDDIEANRDLLGRRLQRMGHEVGHAENGQLALDQLRAAPWDLVMLDVMMPVKDGHATLTELKGDPQLRHIPVIMVSALNEIESITKCITLGAEDYLPKPFDPVLLKARVGASLEKKRLRDREQAVARAMERELEIGRRIQAGFLPTTLPQRDGWELAAIFEPAKQVAGDFYDAFPLVGGRHVAVVAGDVCDKGVGAALFMALFRSLLRAVASEDGALGAGVAAMAGDAPAILRHAVTVTNDYIARTHGDANMFSTLVVAAFDPDSGALWCINGGQEPPVILAPDGTVRTEIRPTGPAAGMLPDIPYGLWEGTLAPGECLVAWTDGVTEARAPSGALFGTEATLAVLGEGCRAGEDAVTLSTRLRNAIRAFEAGDDPADDLTLVTVRRRPA